MNRWMDVVHCWLQLFIAFQATIKSHLGKSFWVWIRSRCEANSHFLGKSSADFLLNRVEFGVTISFQSERSPENTKVPWNIVFKHFHLFSRLLKGEDERCHAEKLLHNALIMFWVYFVMHCSDGVVEVCTTHR